MDYSEKIKALQLKAGIEADGIASSKTWIALYHLLCASIPYDINVNAVIKSIQAKLNVRVSGQATTKTWDALYQVLVVGQDVDDQIVSADPTNEIILKSMTKEVVPFAKELIRLAADKGIYIRLMENTADDELKSQVNESAQLNFGLVFVVGIYEQLPSGEYLYKEQSPLYAEVAKLGESIGLTWARDKKTFSNLSRFELRPAWAVQMKEKDMIKELSRRREENISLLAIL